MAHQKTAMTFMTYITAQDKRVTIEVGELKTTIMLSCYSLIDPRRITNEYNVYIRYSFDYAEKSGDVGGFAISRTSKDEERFECDGIGENINKTLANLFIADYPNASEGDVDDLLNEMLALVKDAAEKNNWGFYDTDYAYSQAHESDG